MSGMILKTEVLGDKPPPWDIVNHKFCMDWPRTESRPQLWHCGDYTASSFQLQPQSEDTDSTSGSRSLTVGNVHGSKYTRKGEND